MDITFKLRKWASGASITNLKNTLQICNTVECALPAMETFESSPALLLFRYDNYNHQREKKMMSWDQINAAKSSFKKWYILSHFYVQFVKLHCNGIHLFSFC